MYPALHAEHCKLPKTSQFAVPVPVQLVLLSAVVTYIPLQAVHPVELQETHIVAEHPAVCENE
jgi:hypothetical protein